LGLELTDTGFDASGSSEFRTRLLTDGQTERRLHQMLERLQAQGYWYGVAGSAATPPAWSRRCASPDRLELVTETLRAALEALAAAAPEWLVALAPED
jgi:hypothetical protein